MENEIKITGQKVPGEDYKQIKRMKSIAVFVLANMYAAGIIVAAAWQLITGSVTIYLYWQWFVVSVFPDLPPINFLQSVIIQLMMFVLIPVSVHPIYSKGFVTQNIDLNQTIINKLITPIFKIAMGWIIYKLFI